MRGETRQWKGMLIPTSAYQIMAVLGMLVLFCLIACSGSDSYFQSGDESGYFANLELIDRYGVSTEFMRHFSGMAGPLHPILHWILLPLTGGVPPGIRFVNFGILLLIFWMFKDEQWYKVVGIPMTFVCGGYAMTELPAMFFLLLSLLLLTREKTENIFVFMAGLCLSLSVAGRWNYLVLLPIFFLYVVSKSNYSKLRITLFVFGSLILPAWILYAWQGLTPPEVKGLPGYGLTDINPENFILSTCFAGMMVLIISPGWFSVIKLNRKRLFYFSLLLLGNVIFGICKFLPAKALFYNIPPSAFPLAGQEKWLGALSIVFGTVSIAITLFFLWALYENVVKDPSAEKRFYAISIILVLLSTIKITHTFSSRYPYQILPFLLLMLRNDGHKAVRWWELALGVAGMGWGILSWLSYQHIY